MRSAVALASILVVLVVSVGFSGGGSSGMEGTQTDFLARRGTVAQRSPREAQPSPRACRAARRAVTFYSSRIEYWLDRKGTGNRGRIASVVPGSRPGACPRYLARVLRLKAYGTRRHVERWLAFHWDWRSWLPANWLAVAICESGRNPPNWSHDSGTYVSAFGIYRSGFGDDAHRIGALSWDETIRKLGRLPTPREQYAAALSHYRTHGDGWGCPGP